MNEVMLKSTSKLLEEGHVLCEGTSNQHDLFFWSISWSWGWKDGFQIEKENLGRDGLSVKSATDTIAHSSLVKKKTWSAWVWQSICMSRGHTLLSRLSLTSLSVGSVCTLHGSCSLPGRWSSAKTSTSELTWAWEEGLEQLWKLIDVIWTPSQMTCSKDTLLPLLVIVLLYAQLGTHLPDSSPGLSSSSNHAISIKMLAIYLNGM